MSDFNHSLMRLVGYEWGGGSCPPGDNLTLRYGELDCGENIYVALVNEDASSLWIGFPDKWLTHMGRDDARRLAWFILWRWWVRAEWCGLRRAIWYWALSRACAKTRRYAKGATDETR